MFRSRLEAFIDALANRNTRNNNDKLTPAILFIDEAYSLVDGSNSFGDEAIRQDREAKKHAPTTNNMTNLRFITARTLST